MVHIYYGNGKGKTTAAVGAAVRAVGIKMKVLFVQFLKNGDSGEIEPLKRLGVNCLFADKKWRLFSDLSNDEKLKMRGSFADLILKVCDCSQEYDMIILDELLDALDLGYVNFNEDSGLMKLLNSCRGEIIITGHSQRSELLNYADYITNMQSVRHPYEKGISARRGIEW